MCISQFYFQRIHRSFRPCFTSMFCSSISLYSLMILFSKPHALYACWQTMNWQSNDQEAWFRRSNIGKIEGSEVCLNQSTSFTKQDIIHGLKTCGLIPFLPDRMRELVQMNHGGRRIPICSNKQRRKERKMRRKKRMKQG